MIENLLDSKPEQLHHCMQFVLIEGGHRVGKITLSLQVCHWWGREELFQQYTVVIPVLVKLRDLTVQRAEGIADLLTHQDGDSKGEIAQHYIY